MALFFAYLVIFLYASTTFQNDIVSIMHLLCYSNQAVTILFRIFAFLMRQNYSACNKMLWLKTLTLEKKYKPHLS